MRGLMAVLFSLFVVFYIVEYEGYDWNPCSGNFCFSVYCGPFGLCHVGGETSIFLNQIQVKEIIDQRGIEHLKNIYQVELQNYDPTKVIVKKLKLVPSFVLREE
jgi:hypothetical protein